MLLHCIDPYSRYYDDYGSNYNYLFLDDGAYVEDDKSNERFKVIEIDGSLDIQIDCPE